MVSPSGERCAGRVIRAMESPFRSNSAIRIEASESPACHGGEQPPAAQNRWVSGGESLGPVVARTYTVDVAAVLALLAVVAAIIFLCVKVLRK